MSTVRHLKERTMEVDAKNDRTNRSTRYHDDNGDDDSAYRNDSAAEREGEQQEEQEGKPVEFHYVPPMEDAASVQKRNEVLGYNHVRRTSKDLEEEEMHRRRGSRRRPVPRWQKKFRWRLRNDRKARWFCIGIMCSTMALASMVALWSLGELIAALAVSGTVMFLGFGACIGAEIIVRCPNAVEWLLYDMGFITPYSPLDLPENMPMHKDADGLMYGDFEYMMTDDGDYVFPEGYDVEIGGGEALSFGSPDIPMSGKVRDYDEKGKPLYGDVTIRVNRPMEKAKRFARNVLKSFHGAWLIKPPSEADLHDEEEMLYADDDDENNDDEYERELESLNQSETPQEETNIIRSDSEYPHPHPPPLSSPFSRELDMSHHDDGGENDDRSERSKEEGRNKGKEKLEGISSELPHDTYLDYTEAAAAESPPPDASSRDPMKIG